jgi:DNA-binding beta-propeller fold protein YncE
MRHIVLLGTFLSILLATTLLAAAAEKSITPEHHFLYVAEPGVRDELDHGGHGILVFDIDSGHKFVRRIPSAGIDETNHVMNVKGICANAKTKRLYMTTPRTMMCFDLVSGKMLWEKSYDGGCDRMAISPDGEIIYLPAFEGDFWNIVDARTGEVQKQIQTKSAGSHNTVVSLDGKFAYLAGLKSPVLRVAGTKSREVIREISFSNSVRPFTINGAQTFCYANVNSLLGFEIGDLQTGKMLYQVEVQGFQKGPVKRHGCPSHGIGLTPDEKELWIADAFNKSVHIFDNTVMPPKQMMSIKLRDDPGWVMFSMDGRYAYPSTGDVIDVKTHKIVSELTDEAGATVQSEKIVEIDFAGDVPVRVGNQFGLGCVAN